MLTLTSDLASTAEARSYASETIQSPQSLVFPKGPLEFVYITTYTVVCS